MLSREMVPKAGLEPARPLRARDFKSLVSANSTTSAWKYLSRNPLFVKLEFESFGNLASNAFFDHEFFVNSDP